MEDTLGDFIIVARFISLYFVLILVLMEDTLGVNVVPQENYVRVSVLILVLMDDTLGEYKEEYLE